MKFTTSALATIAAMATLSLAAPGRVATEVGAAADVGIATDHLPVDKRTSCGHKHCGKCNGTGCKMGSGITYPCTKGKVRYFFLFAPFALFRWNKGFDVY